MKKETFLRIVLGGVAGAQVILGLAGFFSGKPAVKVAAIVYGAKVVLTPQLEYVIRMLGAFMIAIGVMAAFACIDPKRNKKIIDGLIILFTIRVIQRILFANFVMKTFSISLYTHTIETIFFSLIAISLFLLKPRS